MNAGAALRLRETSRRGAAFGGHGHPARGRTPTMRGILLWLIGIPIPIIILLWLFGVLS